MGQKRILLGLLMLGVTMAVPVAAQEQIEVPFHLPTPEGWRTETISFPLDFAPELDFEGVEELRFSPGMFTEIEADFWSYAFVWWVPEETHFDTERLQTDLENYFRGLTLAVAVTREFDPGEPDHDVLLQVVESSSPDQAQWQGTVRTFDVFTTRKPLQLLVRIDIVPCRSQGHTAAFFELSPQPLHHGIWRVLDDIREGFRCEP